MVTAEIPIDTRNKGVSMVRVGGKPAILIWTLHEEQQDTFDRLHERLGDEFIPLLFKGLVQEGRALAEAYGILQEDHQEVSFVRSEPER